MGGVAIGRRDERVGESAWDWNVRAAFKMLLDRCCAGASRGRQREDRRRALSWLLSPPSGLSDN